MSSSRGLSIELPATATTRAFWRCIAPLCVGIDHAGHLAGRIVLDLDRHAVGAHLEIAGRLALGDLGVERRPFRAGLAALEAEADLLAGAAPVARLRC